RKAGEVVNVDDVGPCLIEEVIESRVDRRVGVEHLEAIHVSEVVRHSSYPNAFPFAPRKLEFPVLIARESGEYLNFVPAIAQSPAEIADVDLRSRCLVRKIPADHVNDAQSAHR